MEQNPQIGTNQIDEGAGKNALVGLAALTAMVLPASARTSRSSSTGGSAPVVQRSDSTNPVKFGGYSRRNAINIVARTIFVEAQGEGYRGLEYVASVIWNRSKGDPEKMPGVCKAESQFSCWNGMTPDEWNPKNFTYKERTGPVWDASVALATKMFEGKFNSVGDYTHYYANRGPNAVKTPYWAVGARGHQLKNHIFFTDAELARAKANVAKK